MGGRSCLPSEEATSTILGLGGQLENLTGRRDLLGQVPRHLGVLQPWLPCHNPHHRIIVYPPAGQVTPGDRD